MATYYVSNTGSNTSPYDTKAKAATTLAAALAVATTDGDRILVDYTHTGDNALAADTTFTLGADIEIICIDFGTDAPTPMGTAAWIGHSTLNRGIGIAGARKALMSGLTFRIAGSTGDQLWPVQTDGADYRYENTYFWQGNSSSSNHIVCGRTGGDANCAAEFINCTFRFGNAGQRIRVGARLSFVGGSVSSAGTAPTNLFAGDNDAGGATADWIGGDLSHVTGNILGDCNVQATTVRLAQCKLGVFPPTIATQSVANKGSAEVFAFDCATGDSHGLFAYVNPLGSVSSDTGIYFTSGAAGQSWKIVTTANASFECPFSTPWFGYYNTGTSAITPYIEILRDGSATAYQNDEVWMELMAKVTSGSTQATLSSDEMALLGTPANQDAGAGLGSWTGESGTAWSGKLALTASITPAEAGHISARIVVGEPSITVYADPQIRT